MFLGDLAKGISEMGSLEKSILSSPRRRLTGSSPETPFPAPPDTESEGGLGVISVRHCRVRYVKEEE